MTRRIVRLADVAEAAGTSTKTASRVINGDPRVGAETRKRVQAQVDALGYRVDVMARSLRRGVDDTVGVVVPTIGDPFFALIIEEIERIALARGMTVLIASNPRDPSTERRVVEGMLARRVGGMIIAPFATDYGFLAKVATPVMFLDRHPAGLDTGVVRVDDFAGAYRAVQHLAKHGHRRIALVVDDLEIETSRLRREGYISALNDLGLAVDQDLQLLGCPDAAIAETRTRELLVRRNPPSAILSARSVISLGVVRALHLAKRTDIAVVSFGDFVNADILNPGITVLDHNPQILARVAMERLLKRMNGSDEHPLRDEVIGLHLIARGSGEIRPGIMVAAG
ncbi:MAG: LacI family DNA-binding transcriptional regulator [Chloroflexi bacterium]|nr:LacI family DNA-binding transcriptional regulator [Chloroflexota bacterium]